MVSVYWAVLWVYFRILISSRSSRCDVTEPDVTEPDVKMNEGKYESKRHDTRKGSEKLPSHTGAPVYLSRYEKMFMILQSADLTVKQKFSHHLQCEDIRWLQQQLHHTHTHTYTHTHTDTHTHTQTHAHTHTHTHTHRHTYTHTQSLSILCVCVRSPEQ